MTHAINLVNNLAANLVSQGRYVECEPLFRRVLGIIEAVLPASNPVCGELLILAQDGRVAQACESVGER